MSPLVPLCPHEAIPLPQFPDTRKYVTNAVYQSADYACCHKPILVTSP